MVQVSTTASLLVSPKTAQLVENLLLMLPTPRNLETATSRTTPLDALLLEEPPPELLPMVQVSTTASPLVSPKNAQPVENLLLMLPTPRNQETATSRTTPLDALLLEEPPPEPPLM